MHNNCLFHVFLKIPTIRPVPRAILVVVFMMKFEYTDVLVKANKKVMKYEVLMSNCLFIQTKLIIHNYSYLFSKIP